jgi:site-specific recombinase XerD
MPATPNSICNFIADQASSKDPELKAVTISRRLAAIRYVHKMAGITTIPTDDIRVKQTLRGIMRKKLSPKNQKSPSTGDIIVAMLEQIDTTTLSGLRDRAIILLGFAGAFRRSELVKLRFEDIKIHDKGMDIFIRSSKTDQEGQGFTKPILRGELHCPVIAVQEWADAAGIRSGYLFRAFIQGTQRLRPAENDPNKPEVADILVARVVKKYVSMIGLDENAFGGHSLRSGFVTAALLKGAPYEKIMEVTGQKSVKTLIQYYRNTKKYDDHAGEGLL